MAAVPSRPPQPNIILCERGIRTLRRSAHHDGPDGGPGRPPPDPPAVVIDRPLRRSAGWCGAGAGRRRRRCGRDHGRGPPAPDEALSERRAVDFATFASMMEAVSAVTTRSRPARRPSPGGRARTAPAASDGDVDARVGGRVVVRQRPVSGGRRPCPGTSRSRTARSSLPCSPRARAGSPGPAMGRTCGPRRARSPPWAQRWSASRSTVAASTTGSCRPAGTRSGRRRGCWTAETPARPRGCSPASWRGGRSRPPSTVTTRCAAGRWAGSPSRWRRWAQASTARPGRRGCRSRSGAGTVSCPSGTGRPCPAPRSILILLAAPPPTRDDRTEAVATRAHTERMHRAPGVAVAEDVAASGVHTSATGPAAPRAWTTPSLDPSGPRSGWWPALHPTPAAVAGRPNRPGVQHRTSSWRMAPHRERTCRPRWPDGEPLADWSSVQRAPLVDLRPPTWRRRSTRSRS